MEKKVLVHMGKKDGATSLKRRGPDGGTMAKQSSSMGVKGTVPNGQRSLVKSPNGGVRLPLEERRGMQESSKEEEDPQAADSFSGQIGRRSIQDNNPSWYADDDNDPSDMEADFRTIQREEKRSATIAREEDERELKLIQEKEERERQRKLAKRKQ